MNAKNGQIFASYNKTLTSLKTNRITSNKADTIVLSTLNGHLKVIGCHMNDNQGNYIIITEKGKLLMNDTLFERNHAMFRGGVLRSGASNISINNCLFYNNSAGISGGVAFFGIPSIVYIYNTVFHHNHAQQNGGAIGSRAEALMLYNCTFLGNTAGSNGGAISLLSGKRFMTFNVTFIQNRASAGGGIYAEERWMDMVIQSCTFKNNLVTIDGTANTMASHLGEAISTSLDTIRISDTVFLPSYKQGLIYYSPISFDHKNIQIYTYDCAIIYDNVSLNTYNETFLTEIIRRNIIKSEKKAAITLRETPYASGKKTYNRL